MSPQEKRLARELALQILFQAEFHSPVSTEDLISLLEEKVPPAAFQMTHDLVHGVLEHKKDIDENLQAVSAHWKISRMSFVDRNILRLGIFEMKYSSDPNKPSIVINELVEVAKKFGSTESSAFINGVLDQVAKELAR